MQTERKPRLDLLVCPPPPAAARIAPPSLQIGGALMQAVENSLAQRLTSALDSNPHFNGRTLRFETDGSRVVMQGVVKTYFQKQMAQEAVRRVAGVEQVENCLEVTWA
jgi:osmotically-inducible protein OsmY